MSRWEKFKRWWKYTKAQRMGMSRREERFRGIFTTLEGAENCWYRYHSTGFPVGFPGHLRYEEFIELSVRRDF